MSEIKELRSQALDLLRFPLAVVIVLVHVLSVDRFVLLNGDFYVGNSWGFVVINRFVSAFFQGQSVPIYYFISGYVFFYSVEFTTNTYFKKITNRIKTLFIPYVIWNFVYVALYLSKTISFVSLYSVESDIIFGWKEFLMAFWGYSKDGQLDMTGNIYPINYPLWFLRDLMVVVLLTPIINYCIKNFSTCFIVLIGMLWFVANVEGWGRAAQLLSAFFFFSFGAYMSINKKDMISEFYKYLKLSVISYVLLGIIVFFLIDNWPNIAQIVKTIRILMGLLFAYNLSIFLLNSGYCKVNKFLASSSFFIYLSHAWIFERIRRVLFSIIDLSSNLMIIIAYLLTVVCSILVLLLIYYVGKKYVPRTFNVMIGGR